ncbi:flagellar hook assembly protein FlgD [Pandoraea nosoerga]|nr:flagellar hook capping FlgD N-terminal domain-containing protein [Pandoraea nosoerga]
MIDSGAGDAARAAARTGTGIGGIGGIGGGRAIGAPAPGEAASDTRDMFTKLLVAQIRHQDPLNPSDPAQFVAQLTQMSQTDAMHDVSRRVLDQTKALASMQAFALGGHVGREVSVAVERVVRADGGAVRGAVELPEHTRRAEIVLRDSRGVSVRKAIVPSPNAQTAFHLDDAWFAEHRLGAGTYAIHAEADGQRLPVRVTGQLTRVHLDGGQARVDVAGVDSRIDAASLVELSGGASPHAS